jgi:hypothetical protein
MRLDDITNRIVSASASLIAIAALGTAIYQAKLSRDQAKAAVWPYLIQGNAGNNGYARIVQNVGIGPAVIKAFEVRVDGKPVQNWAAAAQAMGVHLRGADIRSTSFARGFVVPMGAEIDLLQLHDTTDIAGFRSRLEHLQTWVCYCSIYGDCWSLLSDDDEPKQVKACVEDPRRRFKE